MSKGTEDIADDVPIHRIGDGSAANLMLKSAEQELVPPGISVLWGGSPTDAAEAMRRQFPRVAPKGRAVVGSTTAGIIRSAGFDVIMNPTRRFPHHARVIHPHGVAGFTQENLERLSLCFENHVGI